MVIDDLLGLSPPQLCVLNTKSMARIQKTEINSLQSSENSKQNKSSSGFQKEFDYITCDSATNECVPSFALLLNCNDPICGDV